MQKNCAFACVRKEIDNVLFLGAYAKIWTNPSKIKKPPKIQHRLVMLSALQLAKVLYCAFEKCHPGLSCIFRAFLNYIFFHRIYFFLRNINKSLSSHFENQCSAIIILHEVIIAGYDATFYQ